MPELLRLLDISGCIVTIDAIGTQTEICETIIKGGGDYLLAVKENQVHLFEDIQCLFGVDVPLGMKYAQYSYAKSVNIGKSRIRFTGLWTLPFGEDENRVRQDHAAENLAVLRHMALNLLKNEKTAKGGIHAQALTG